MNYFILVGNIIKKPVVKETSNGNKYCQFLIKEERSYKNAEGEYDTDTYNITYWHDLADNNFKEGDIVSIRGRFQSNNYEKDDVTYYHPDLICERIQLFNH